MSKPVAFGGSVQFGSVKRPGGRLPVKPPVGLKPPAKPPIKRPDVKHLPGHAHHLLQATAGQPTAPGLRAQFAKLS